LLAQPNHQDTTIWAEASLAETHREKDIMNFTKKFDRAFQWAGEKMGGEARTSLPDEFKILEAETTMRQEGM
jgi:hypothetical protein